MAWHYTFANLVTVGLCLCLISRLSSASRICKNEANGLETDVGDDDYLDVNENDGRLIDDISNKDEPDETLTDSIGSANKRENSDDSGMQDDPSYIDSMENQRNKVKRNQLKKNDVITGYREYTDMSETRNLGDGERTDLRSKRDAANETDTNANNTQIATQEFKDENLMLPTSKNTFPNDSQIELDIEAIDKFLNKVKHSVDDSSDDNGLDQQVYDFEDGPMSGEGKRDVGDGYEDDDIKNRVERDKTAEKPKRDNSGDVNRGVNKFDEYDEDDDDNDENTDFANRLKRDNYSNDEIDNGETDGKSEMKNRPKRDTHRHGSKDFKEDFTETNIDDKKTKQRHNPKDGYGDWSEWSECSTACGLGWQFRRRFCYDSAHCRNGDLEERICEGIMCT